MRYRWHTGSFAWLIHRVTGILLTLYIFLHLYVLSHLRDPLQYESLMRFMKNPFVRLSEIGLLGLVISHSLNGFRLTLIDLGISTSLQKLLFWIAVSIGFLLFMVGSWPMIRGGIY